MRRIRPVLRRFLPGPQALGNTAWLFTERIARLGSLFVFQVLVARIYGPEAFGQYVQAWALVTLFAVPAALGMESLLVSRLVLEEEGRAPLLGSALAMRATAAAVLTVCATAFMWMVLEPGNRDASILVLVLSAATIPQAFEVVDTAMQASSRFRQLALAKLPALMVGLMLKLVAIFALAPLWVLALIVLLENLLLAGAASALYQRFHPDMSSWRWSSMHALSLISASWPLALSGVMVVVYMRIDQLMIAAMLGHVSAGLYSSVVQLTEMWYVIPTTVSAAVFPLIVRARLEGTEVFLRSVRRLYALLTWTSLVVAVIVGLGSRTIMELVFGSPYASAAPLLALNIWAGVLVAQGVARGYWLMAEGLQRFSFYYFAAGAFTNIGLNIVLIPSMGTYGAVVATVVAQAVAVYIAPLLFRETRVSSRMLLKSWAFR